MLKSHIHPDWFFVINPENHIYIYIWLLYACLDLSFSQPCMSNYLLKICRFSRYRGAFWSTLGFITRIRLATYPAIFALPLPLTPIASSSIILNPVCSCSSLLSSLVFIERGYALRGSLLGLKSWITCSYLSSYICWSCWSCSYQCPRGRWRCHPLTDDNRAECYSPLIYFVQL